MALVPSDDPAACKNGAPTLPWSEMFRSSSLRRPKQEEDAPPKPLPTAAMTGGAADIVGMSLEPDARLALYISMAHTGLVTALLVLYGLYRLLADFLRPL